MKEQTLVETGYIRPGFVRITSFPPHTHAHTQIRLCCSFSRNATLITESSFMLLVIYKLLFNSHSPTFEKFDLLVEHLHREFI